MDATALGRLKAAGWTPARKADISPIEKAYADFGMEIPPRLREFFARYGFLRITFDIRHAEPERHTLDPARVFLNCSDRADFEDLFAGFGVPGTAYPVGFAHRGNMEIFFHDDGNFYLFMEGGPLIRSGSSGEALVAALCGDKSASAWEYL